VERLIVSIERDLEDIVPVFLNNRQKDLLTIRTALSQQDFETIKVLGHRMRGDGGGYGFDTISRIGAIMETAASRGDRFTIEAQARQLEDFLARVHVEYR
jgi:HPt (histidine-containing phosphotransfer) domain-containing protein